MKGPGILWMLQTVAGISMSGPIFVVGLEYLRSGRIVGGIGFLALGAATFYFPTYLLNRIGGPRTWVRRRIGRGDEAEDGSETGSTTATLDSDADDERGTDEEPARGSLIGRLRDR